MSNPKLGAIYSGIYGVDYFRGLPNPKFRFVGVQANGKLRFQHLYSPRVIELSDFNSFFESEDELTIREIIE